MANPWFRLYSEFSHDPKVQMMPEAMQRRYLMLMCLQCSNALETLHETEMAFHLRISELDLTETKALFLAKGFIDEHWNLVNWEKRQYASDSSTERVRKLRKARKDGDETPVKRCSNGTEQNRTDTDTDKKKQGTPAPFVVPEWVDRKALDRFIAMRKKIRKPVADDALPLLVAKLESLRRAGHNPTAVLDQSVMNSWQGLFEVKGDGNARPDATVGMYKGPTELSAEEREEAGRQEVLVYWREIRGRDPAGSYLRAPTWVKKILDEERA